MSTTSRYFSGVIAGMLFACLAWLGIIHLQLGVATESSRWSFEINAEKVALASRIRGPKVLLVGGSSTLFGMNAGELEKQTGRPVINMGMHAALGLDYMFAQVKSVAAPGDVIVLAPEYELYESYPEKADAFSYGDYLYARDPQYYAALLLTQKIELALRVPAWRVWLGHVNRFDPEPYIPNPWVYGNGRHLLTTHGDQARNDAARRPAPGPALDRVCKPLASGWSGNPHGFEKLDRFIGWARATGVTVIATFPALMENPAYSRQESREIIAQISEFYHRRGVQIVGTVTENLRPRNEFFDTNYHLMHEAAIARARRFAPELLKHIPPSQ
jgi:hypothetical protein